MMEGLGRLFNVAPIAAGKSISLKNAAGVTFVCTGNDTFTVKSQPSAGGTATNLAAITRKYSCTATDGTAAWTDSGDIAPTATATIASGAVCFYIDAADLPAGASYVEVAVAASGLVIAIPHDLAIQASPNLLPILNA